MPASTETDAPSLTDVIHTLHTRCVSQDTLDALPDPVAVFNDEGVLVAENERLLEFWKQSREHSLIGKLNLFKAPGIEPTHLPLLRRALAGESCASETTATDLRDDPTFTSIARKQVWLQVLFAPLRVDGVVRFALLSFRDRTAEKTHQSRFTESEAQVIAQQETIAALRSAQEHIARQQDTIRELSTPIIEVWPGVLTLPVVGNIDERRAAEMTERLLATVTRLRARRVILDLTGVGTLDAATADHLLRIVGAVKLLGGKTMVAGINPDVAQTIVELGIDLKAIRTVRSLRNALAEIFAEDGK